MAPRGYVSYHNTGQRIDRHWRQSLASRPSLVLLRRRWYFKGYGTGDKDERHDLDLRADINTTGGSEMMDEGIVQTSWGGDL